MFTKLLRNLPFNPSLIDQVAFYAKRLKRDAYIRRLGFLLMVLTMFVQMYAVVSPVEPTLASSSNDLVQGGIESAADAAHACRSNTSGFGDVLHYYNIDCDDVAKATETTIDSSDHSAHYQTAGRLTYGKTGETPVAIKGRTVWYRNLKDLDNGSPKHAALKGTSKDGHTYYIVKSCAGLTYEDTPPAPAPKCEWNQALLSSDPKCFEPCPLAGKQTIAKSSPQCTDPCPYKGKTKLSSKDSNCFDACPYAGKESIAKASSKCFAPCQYSPDIAAGEAACKPCEAAVSSQNSVACLVLSKSVHNDSTNGDANGTTAKAGDSLTYTLAVKNDGKTDIKNFVIQENVADVLDYADIVSLNGGAADKDQIATWPAVTVPAGKTVSKQFTVKIRNPVPSTPVSASDPNHFDLTLTNVYGNAVSVKVPASVVKSAEVITRTLPNTGPGSSLIIGFSMVAVAGYFYARSRLLAQELVIIKQEHVTSGGY